jgi:tetratricopeptide (TPR) repeat protein
MIWQRARPTPEVTPTRAPSAGKYGLDDASTKFLPGWCRRGWLAGLLLVALTLAAYQPVWNAGYIWDDDEFLTAHPLVNTIDFQKPDCFYRLWLTPSAPDYYPMTFSLWAVESRLWGTNPSGCHLVNVLLHAFSAVLLWRVLLRLKIPGALLGAAIFALHPVNVESAAWISEGKNTLAMFFFTATLLFWLKFEDSGRRRWYGLALAGFAAGMFSKSAVAPLPFVLLGIAWWRRGRVSWTDLRRVIPFFAVSVAICCVTVWVHYTRAMAHEAVRTDGLWSRLAVAGWAVWFYFYKAVLPLKLIFVYPRWQINVGHPLTWAPLILVIAVLVLCWKFRERWGRGVVFGAGYFVVMLLPVLGFLNIYFMRYSLVADHWQYFAIIGPIALAGALIRRPMVAATLLLALGALTWEQCGMYVSNDTLWQTTVRRNPGCWLAWDSLGDGLFAQGKVSEAISNYEQALDLNPEDMEAHGSLGNAFLMQGKIHQAVLCYEEAVQLKPGYAPGHNNLGYALAQEGRLDEAIAQYETALEINPGVKDVQDNLGEAFLREGKMGQAIAHFEKALDLGPADPRLENNTAWILARCPDKSLRDARKAVALASDANKLTGGTNALFLHTLATAFAETGQVSNAVQTTQDALKIAQAQSNFRLAGQLQTELARYEADEPQP